MNPPELTVNVGDLARFHCYVPGQHAQGLTWSYKVPGQSLPEGAYEDRGVLIIEHAKAEHVGEYLCTQDTAKGLVHAPHAKLIVNNAGTSELI